MPLSDFNGAGSFWKGAATLQFYWACFAVILAVIAHLLWPRGTDLGLRRAAAADARAMRRRPPLAIAGVAAVAMAATGAYAYHNIKQLNRYQTSRRGREISAPTTSANISNMRSCRARSSPRSTLDVQLFPKERRLVVDGRYDLRNDTNAPIRDVHVRQGDRDTEFLKLDLAGARLVVERREVRLSHLPLRPPLAPGRDDQR